MKRLIYISFVVLFILFININVNAEEVKITGIEFDSKSDGVIINKEASFDNLNIYTDVHFTELNDFIKYKITINNKEDEDFKLDVSKFRDSEYLDYIFDSDYILNANGDTVMYLTIKYTKYVEESKYINKKYSESNVSALTFQNSKGEIINVNNPNTGSILFVIIRTAVSILVVSFFVYVIIYSKGSVKVSIVLFIMSFLFIPMFVSALNNIKITINTKADFSYLNDEMCINQNGRMYSINFRNGMKFSELTEFIFNNRDLYPNTTDYSYGGSSESYRGYSYDYSYYGVTFDYISFERRSVLYTEIYDEEYNSLLGTTDTHYELTGRGCGKNDFPKDDDVLRSKNDGCYYTDYAPC